MTRGVSLAMIGLKLNVDAGTMHSRLRGREVPMRDTQGQKP